MVLCTTNKNFSLSYGTHTHTHTHTHTNYTSNVTVTNPSLSNKTLLSSADSRVLALHNNTTSGGVIPSDMRPAIASAA